jgi:signal transduction histidine kinase
VPDPWEAQGLRAFEQGTQVVFGLGRSERGGHLRLMRPFITEKPCLVCHEAQGYKEGEIRGGISVSVPMAPFWAGASKMLVMVIISHGFFWILGIAGIGVGTARLRRQFSQRVRAEEALRESVRLADQERERAKAAEAKARLIQGLAHEVRNPLFAIKVNAAALEKAASALPDTARNIGFVQGHVARLEALMRDLLELVNAPSETEMVECRLGDAVDTAVSDVVSRTPEASGRIVVEMPAGTCTQQSIPERIEKALVLLIENALQNSSPGDRVWIRAGRSGNHAVLEVVDEGSGIAETVREHLFEPFVTTHTGRRGLGLVLAKDYLASIGCTIEAANNDPPPGATFTVTLPLPAAGEEEGLS